MTSPVPFQRGYSASPDLLRITKLDILLRSETPNIIRPSALSAACNLCTVALMSVSVSASYVFPGKMHSLKTFLLRLTEMVYLKLSFIFLNAAQVRLIFLFSSFDWLSLSIFNLLA